MTVLKGKNTMLVWMQNGCKFISHLTSWPPGWLGAAVAATAQGHERMPYCIISSPRKGPDSKYDFYQVLVNFAAGSSQKNRKLSHSRPWTLCIGMRTVLSKKCLEDLPRVEHRELRSVLRGSLDGRGVWRRMDTCICMAESIWCSPETVTTLLIGYTPIQIKKFKNKWINNFLKGNSRSCDMCFFYKYPLPVQCSLFVSDCSVVLLAFFPWTSVHILMPAQSSTVYTEETNYC